MFRVKLICTGVPSHLGDESARDITLAFVQRPWHEQSVCTWDGTNLNLEVVNDFDFSGLATQDEFSDEISANIELGFDGDLYVASIVEF